MASDRVGLLIIRAWLEEGSAEPLRAQIRLTTDVATGFERALTVTRAEQVGAAVDAWLSDVLSDLRSSNGA